MAINGVNRQLSTMISKYSELRTGTVTEQIDPFRVTVDVGGTLLRAAYIRAARPVSGDVVAVLRQGAGWFVLGTTSDSGVNEVQNPSFEQVDEDSQPLLWTLYNVTNTAQTESVEAAGEAVDGNRVLEVMPTAALTSTSFVYSAPISVVAGQVWELSAYVNGFYPADNEDTTDVGLYALWFGSASALYPTTAAADTNVKSAVNITEGETMSVLTGTVTVPVSPSYMRVALRTVALSAAGAHWDLVTARMPG